MDKSFKSEMKKHPERFEFLILQVFDTRQLAELHEIELHKKYKIHKNPDFYNTAYARSNGFGSDWTGRKHSKETLDKMSEVKRGRKHSKETLDKMSIIFTGEKNPFFGKKHSKETLDKMSEIQKGKLAGDKNPMYGEVHSRELLDQIRLNNSGEKNHMFGKKRPEHAEGMKKRFSRMCIIDGIEYESGKCASEILGLSRSCVSVRLRNPDWLDWNYK
ncbi:endonuclease [Paraglaciecola Antarctic GD virus 1]|nr:endonuclease [Paraglaciecola Antarctic GD virus 1]